MSFEPREIILCDDNSRIRIIWSDGMQSEFEALTLRRNCPCASCVNEWTGEKMLRDEEVEASVKIEDISLVGRYAINLRFSDGHETGIYSFRYLREL
ncbi:MAG: DUF971 domain-containing protein [Acidobacteriota bacterium]|nr:DUF971 domain-containing protein [Pyrinomonadaceae bacterium]MDW8304731.1 DUF971 domain-containing protein [Acidobacteriota bacterium]